MDNVSINTIVFSQSDFVMRCMLNYLYAHCSRNEQLGAINGAIVWYFTQLLYIHYILLKLSVLGLCLRINYSGLFAGISLTVLSRTYLIYLILRLTSGCPVKTHRYKRVLWLAHAISARYHTICSIVYLIWLLLFEVACVLAIDHYLYEKWSIWKMVGIVWCILMMDEIDSIMRMRLTELSQLSS